MITRSYLAKRVLSFGWCCRRTHSMHGRVVSDAALPGAQTNDFSSRVVMPQLPVSEAGTKLNRRPARIVEQKDSGRRDSYRKRARGVEAESASRGGARRGTVCLSLRHRRAVVPNLCGAEALKMAEDYGSRDSL